MSVRRVLPAIVAAIALASCGPGPTAYGSDARARASGPSASHRFGSSSNYIQHVVVVIQENRSFDNLFSTFPGADGTGGGCMEAPSRLRHAPVRRSRPRLAPCPSGDAYVPLAESDLVEPCDYSHHYVNFTNDYDGGNMDGFGTENGNKVACPGKAGTAVYQYVDPTQIAPDWTIAQQYVLGDHMFQTQGSGSFTAHQDLIAASTIINPAKTKSLVDFPDHTPWGCDAPAGTRTDLLFFNGSSLQFQYHKGPSPCLTYETLRDLLDARSVSWKYYSPPIFNKHTGAHAAGALWNAFDAIKAVRRGPQWKDDVPPPKLFFHDVAKGTLPAVSWIVPDETNSDHPGNDSDTGPSWVASIVNAIGQSSYWDSTAIVVVWDDWGGFYDHEPPPFFDDWGGLGFRVPMLVVSAYARETYPGYPGYISHTQYEFGSILRFIEDTWGLGTLGTTDARATSIVDCFDFTQPPRSFTPIASKYSQSYFERQAPSNKPVDTE